MGSHQDATIPYPSAQPDGLYQERAEATIALARARAARCELRGRLLLEHANVPDDLRRATVNQHDEVRAATERALAAQARFELAQAGVASAEYALAERQLLTTARAVVQDGLDELRLLAEGCVRTVQEAAELIKEAAGRGNDR